LGFFSAIERFISNTKNTIPKFATAAALLSGTA
jgi:hypothetical protein